MGILDQTIYNVYKCDNSECNAEVAYKQQVKDKWKKKCPFCNKKSLYLQSGNLSISTFVDMQKPTTIGMISQQNRDRYLKENGKDYFEPKKTPWWRKNKKIDYSILKNPKQYIETGHT